MNMTFYGTGKFKAFGSDTAFVKNHTYAVEIRTHWRGRITVTAVHGYEALPLEGCTITYDNLISFLADWDLSDLRTTHTIKEKT